MRVSHFFTILVVIGFVVRVAVTDDGLDESQAIKKIELLGGKITRDDKLPGRPVISVWVNENSRFNDKYFQLLKPFKNLTTLGFLYRSFEGGTKITDVGVKELKELKSLTRRHFAYAEITDAGLKELCGLERLTNLRLWGMIKISDEFRDHSMR